MLKITSGIVFLILQVCGVNLVGDPGTKMITSEIGAGLQYLPPTGGLPNLGVIDTVNNDQFFVSLTVHY